MDKDSIYDRTYIKPNPNAPVQCPKCKVYIGQYHDPLCDYGKEEDIDEQE